jgi:hypothetical protein
MAVHTTCSYLRDRFPKMWVLILRNVKDTCNRHYVTPCAADTTQCEAINVKREVLTIVLVSWSGSNLSVVVKYINWHIRLYLVRTWTDVTSSLTACCTNYTSQQDFVPRKVYCVSNVIFHAESKYAITIFPSPTVFVQWNFYYWFFEILAIFFSDFFLHEQNILNCFEHRVVTYSLPLSNH